MKMIRVQQKPWRLMAELILRFTDPDQLVIDPFVGVGSTAAAAIHTGRRFMGCDRRRQGGCRRGEQTHFSAQQGEAAT